MWILVIRNKQVTARVLDTRIDVLGLIAKQTLEYIDRQITHLQEMRL